MASVYLSIHVYAYLYLLFLQEQIKDHYMYHHNVASVLVKDRRRLEKRTWHLEFKKEKRKKVPLTAAVEKNLASGATSSAHIVESKVK